MIKRKKRRQARKFLRTLRLLLFGIVLVLLGIFCAVLTLYTDADLMCILAFAFSFAGLIVSITGPAGRAEKEESAKEAQMESQETKEI